MSLTPAALFRALPDGRIQCGLCRHFCLLAPGQRGRCGVREADGAGVPQSLVGDGIAACNVDPVEKKPLYHYLPGSRAFSFGTEGCNMDCAWCQNDGISRSPAETGRVRSTPAAPRELVLAAQEAGCACIAFTYTEPTVFFELMTATADLALASGLGSVMVSNGYQSPDCLEELRHRIQAANIDLKSFRDESYRHFCGARLQGVLDNLKIMRAMGWWLEVTTLVVPGVNDDPAELRDMARFLREELGPETPWHLSAFHPCRHMMDRGPTPLSTLQAAWEIGKSEGLAFVYLGNVPAGEAATVCPGCGCVLVKRGGFQAVSVAGFHGQCPQCGRNIPGVWS